MKTKQYGGYHIGIQSIMPLRGRLFCVSWRKISLIVFYLLFISLGTVTCLGMMNEFVGLSMHEIEGDDVFFEIIKPEELAFTYRIRPALDFGTTFNSTFLVRNIPLVIVDPPTACDIIFNADDIRGHVALVQRGECSFSTKSVTMEKVGAVAVIVTDDDKNNDALYVEMIDDNVPKDVNIPVGFLLGKSGYLITSILNALSLKHALINLPVNISTMSVNQLNQPPWLGW